jgi:CO/xanthine dehydrogenase Mo-binding subunit/aerobic-type carbon monoxide dehydrogenase small subunit (CoxS/CutS family)
VEEHSARIELTLKVNGKAHRLFADPRQSLIGFLRDDLGLTGTKQGCDDGACGTCMVTVNGAMARACRLPVARVNGKEVVTIEGLGTAEHLHPLQEAFIDADAVQCGFCTPGAIMAAKALLDRNPAPTREQIAKALGSNLCRCTGYVSMLDAVSHAAERVAGGQAKARAIHPQPEAHRRGDARDKACGTALYAADLVMPGMIHGAVLRSPHFHADVLDIDETQARALPGVIAVVTARDVPGVNRYGRAVKDQRVLADGRVRQIGDALAAVAATTPEIAAHAVSLVRVTYRPLPVIVDPAEALKEGAFQIHDGGNLLGEKKTQWGDAEAALAKSDLVIDEAYTTPFVEHAYLEPEAALAYRDDEGRLVVRSATQHSHLHRREIADTMALPLESVRILPTVIGGAFGAKTDISCECIVALLALKTGRPVKIVYSRAESFASTTKRHPFRMRCRTGVTREGRLTALAAEVLADTGAYASAGPGIMVRAFVSLVGPYQFPNVAIHGRVVYTNNTTAGAMRGYGACQVAFAIESQMDMMAAALGIDPLQFRLMNRRRTAAAVATPQDREQEAAYLQTIEAVRPYYEQAVRVRQTSAADSRLRRGVGIASMRYGIGYSGQKPPESFVELESDGRVRLLIGSIDMGQGTDTALALIAARELTLPLDHVAVVSGDTALTPDNGASSGSRVIYTDGNAVKEAAGRLKDAILTTASRLLERSYESLELKDARVAPRPETGASGPSVSLAEVARARLAQGLPLRFKGEFHAVRLHDPLTGEPSPYLVHVSATHVTEVEVDMRRGTVRVLRVIAAHDVGRAIFHQGLKGQIEGAVSMGMGFALKEEFRPGETTGFEQYRIPTAREMPEIITLLVENIDPSANLGAKGAAECATVAVAPAIINAIANATGTRIHNLPAMPVRLMPLLGSVSG